MVKPIFILFNGFNSSKLWWEYEYTGSNILTKHNFLNELKKIGHVYLFNLKFFNVDYYYQEQNVVEKNKWNKIYKKYKPHSSNIDFDLDDLNYDDICEMVYDDIKVKYQLSKRLVLIGHSYGSEVAYTFSKKYNDKVLFNIFLDGSFHSQGIQKEIFKNSDKKHESMIKKKFSNDEDLHKILDKIKNGVNVNKEIELVRRLISYHSFRYKIDNFDKKLYVPTIFFRVVDLKGADGKFQKMWNKYGTMENKEIAKNNDPSMYKFIYVSNVSHFMWYDEQTMHIIIKEIKKLLKSIVIK